MKNSIRGLAAAWALALALTTLVVPGSVAAQGVGGVPTFVAIPDAFPDLEGPLVVLRETGRNIILLRASDATPEALSVGLGLLKSLTERKPLEPGLAQLAPVTGFHFRTPLGTLRHAQLEDLLERLRTRPVALIGNLGTGRFLALTPTEAGT